MDHFRAYCDEIFPNHGGGPYVFFCTRPTSCEFDLKSVTYLQMAKLTSCDLFPPKNTLAARGLEEPRNSQELLIESVGPVFLFCVLCHIVSICCFSVVLKYYIPLIHACIDAVSYVLYLQTDGRTHEINLGGWVTYGSSWLNKIDERNRRLSSYRMHLHHQTYLTM